MGFTKRLVEYAIDNNKYDLLPADVVDRSKEMMINAAGVALAAAAQPDSRILTEVIQDLRGNGKCTIIGMGLRTSPSYAALANGMMINLLDFDDEITQSDMHLSSTILPVVMALGEMNGASGQSVIAAYSMASEITARIAECCELSARKGSVRNRHSPVHMDGVLGVIGATCAGALMQGLGEREFIKAIGIACGSASGISGNFATAARAYQCGQSAMNGLMASVLASHGISSADNPLESEEGLLNLFWGFSINEEEFFTGLANPYRLIDPGVTLKLYPCDSASHTAIEAVLQLLQQHTVDPNEVASVNVSITRAAMDKLPVVTPTNGWESRFCLSYIVAATLLHGHPLLDFFTDPAVENSEVRHAMDMISIQATELPSNVSANPCTVSIVLNTGRKLENKVDFARGQPEMPLDREEVDAKFLYCTRYILPPDHIGEAIDSFRNLENIENVTGMFSVLGG
jgi:2-methylcitrate dehydratase PrpD